MTFKQLVVPPSLRRLFYVSWEDALWDLLRFFHFPDKSICLVPEFFCMDVVKNMEEHGLQCVYYPVDQQLQTDLVTFTEYLKKYEPSAIIILHIAGITNQLFAQSETWLEYLPADALLVEDCVHRIIDPQQIKFLTPKHVLIDSLRKVVPMYGSNLYGVAATFSHFKQTPWWKTVLYQLQVFWWWWLFQVCLHMGWNLYAQKVMQKGYDLIGDSQRGAPGPWFFSLLSQYLNPTKIEEVKKQQVARYHTLLTEFWNNPVVYQIKFDQSDAGKLRGFPIGINLENTDQLLVQLQQHQLAWKYELDDCPWSKRQKIIYLPLGPHLHLNDVDTICQLLIRALKNVNSVVS